MSKVLISNIAAAAILIISLASLIFIRDLPMENMRILDVMVGISLTYLFTENVVNGTKKSNSEGDIEVIE
jgi:small neutral amino acid transporter SnatA (MarC family)